MIVGTCGFGSTGSSAVSDYLSEFSNVQVLDDIEFTLVSDLDGLIDLEYHLMHSHKTYYDSQLAIYRFLELIKIKKIIYKKTAHIEENTFVKLGQDFINEISMVEWRDFLLDADGAFLSHIKDAVFRRRLIKNIEIKTKRRLKCYPMKTVRLSVCPENFYTAAKKYVQSILSEMGADFNKIIVLDQPFAGNNPQACFPFYEEPYAIVVDRDPRDNYVFAKTKLLGRNHYIPLDTVNDFVTYYRALRINQPYKETNNRILRINFEDLVYDYENTTMCIRNFLNLPENPHPKTVFDPNLSIANTQVFKRFPEYSADIAYIEEHLEQYLFDFEQYGEQVIPDEMFFGKSPLHK